MRRRLSFALAAFLLLPFLKELRKPFSVHLPFKKNPILAAGALS